MINIQEALKIVAEHGIKISTESMRYWCKKHDIGKKIFGKWYIDEKKLLQLLDGKNVDEG